MTDAADLNGPRDDEGADGDRSGKELMELRARVELVKNEEARSGVDLSGDLTNYDGLEKQGEKTREGEGTDSGFGSSGSSQQSITLPESQVGVFLC